jgi:hypothetical protein
MPWCAKIYYHTHTCATCFGNTAGFSVPVLNPIDDEPGQFSVQSQSNPQIIYHIDIEAYTCDCSLYSLIFYCKHLAAIQLHFYKELAYITKPNTDLAVLASIPAKLQKLAVHTRLSPLHHMSDPLHQLDSLLNLLLAGSVQLQVLPKPKKVAPNQHSWSETVSVTGANTKKKYKTAHTDPYSEGQ